jgi:hypothetical protein
MPVCGDVIDSLLHGHELENGWSSNRSIGPPVTFKDSTSFNAKSMIRGKVNGKTWPT